jgi:flagellar motor switch protein FliG
MMPDIELNGAKKAAILLLALGVEIASMVLKHMSEGEIQRISNYMSHLVEVEADEVNKVLDEFHYLVTAYDAMVMGGEGYVRKLLLKTLTPERANWIMGNLSVPSIETGLEALKWLDHRTIAGFLQGEHPQTVAAIMAHLEPAQAGAVMAALPETQRADVLMRIAKLERIPPGVIRDLDRVLQTELKATGALETDKVGGVIAVAEILNNIDQASEHEILGSIEELDTDLAEEIRQLMFTFEDLQGADDRGMQAILREVSNEELTLALKTASEELREKILRNMSQRAASMLREELEIMGPVRISDVEQAQLKITQTAKRLEEEGKIVLMGKGDDSFV